MSGSPASSVAARLISAVEATCGRWLTMATSRSWRNGSITTGLAPTFSAHAETRAVAASPVAGEGVRTHTIPSRTEGEAQSGPERSEPPMGWPPTNRSLSPGWTVPSTSTNT